MSDDNGIVLASKHNMAGSQNIQKTEAPYSVGLWRGSVGSSIIWDAFDAPIENESSHILSSPLYRLGLFNRWWSLVNHDERIHRSHYYEDLFLLIDLLDQNRLDQLMRDHGLRKLMDPASSNNNEYRELSEVVVGDWHKLEHVVDLRESVRNRARFDYRLMRLRPFQQLMRHRICCQRRSASSGLPPFAADVLNACAEALQRVPPSDQLLRLRVTLVLSQLPAHYRSLAESWGKRNEIRKQTARSAAACIESIMSRRELIVEKHRKKRLKLLKENDFAAYLELIKESKNARIEELLRQTEKFLEGLSLKTKLQQRTTEEAREAQKSVASYSSHGVSTGAAAIEAPRCQLYASAFQTQQTETLTCQPACLTGGLLMPYQLAGVQFLLNLYSSDLSGVLADEMGLGKTVQTIALLGYLKETKRMSGPHLVVVPLSTLPNWIAEFERWCPSLRVVQFRGTKPERRKLGALVKAGAFNVCLTTYDWVIREKATLSHPFWCYIIVDEGHRMKNAKSKFHLTLTEFQSTHRLLLTGTPLQNNLTELWSLLNFLLPKIFTSAADFELWFEQPFRDFPGDTTGELTEEEKFLVINRLHSVLRPFLLRRVKADVLCDLPEKREHVVHVQLSAWQRLAYRQISSKAIRAQRDDSKVTFRSFNNVMMQLRKITNHPYLFEDEYFVNENLFRVSGKFEVLDRMLPKLIHFNHKILIFCQMTQLMDILEDYLDYKHIAHCRLDGSTTLELRTERMAAFNDPASSLHVFMLSTRAGGLGLNLQAADTVVLFDSDWNPHQDLQAQARAHRLGQKNEVRVFRFVTVSAAEEAILAKAQRKLDIDVKIIQAGMFNSRFSEEQRHEKLRELLYSKDIERKVRVTTPQELNRFMARNEEEEEFFQAYDEKLFGAENFKSFEERCCADDKQEVDATMYGRSSARSRVLRSAMKRDVRAVSNKRADASRKKRAVDIRDGARDAMEEESVSSRQEASSAVESSTANIGGSFHSDDKGRQTEEELLIKCNRLMSLEEVPENWREDDDDDDDAVKKTAKEDSPKLLRRCRKSTVNPDTLSETAFVRALNRLENGEAKDLHEAVAMEKREQEGRRAKRAGNNAVCMSSDDEDMRS